MAAAVAGLAAVAAVGGFAWIELRGGSAVEACEAVGLCRRTQRIPGHPAEGHKEDATEEIAHSWGTFKR